MFIPYNSQVYKVYAQGLLSLSVDGTAVFHDFEEARQFALYVLATYERSAIQEIDQVRETLLALTPEEAKGKGPLIEYRDLLRLVKGMECRVRES